MGRVSPSIERWLRGLGPRRGLGLLAALLHRRGELEGAASDLTRCGLAHALLGHQTACPPRAPLVSMGEPTFVLPLTAMCAWVLVGALLLLAEVRPAG